MLIGTDFSDRLNEIFTPTLRSAPKEKRHAIATLQSCLNGRLPKSRHENIPNTTATSPSDASHRMANLLRPFLLSSPDADRNSVWSVVRRMRTGAPGGCGL